jgi:hypothetical protein
LDLDNFNPSTDEDVQQLLDYTRYSEDAYLGVIPPSEHLRALTSCLEHLLKRIQQLESRIT